MSDDIITRADSEYSRLRDWYLARLRRNALEKAHNNDLTPLALIQKDQLLVKELGEKTAPILEGTERPDEKIAVHAYLIAITAWIALALVCMLGQAELPQMITMIYKMSLAALIGDTADQSMSFIPAWLVGALVSLFFALLTLATLFGRDLKLPISKKKE